MYRVRELIPYLDVQQLIKDRIIPDLSKFEDSEALIIKKYPPVIHQGKGKKSNNYGLFGIFVELVIHEMLKSFCKSNSTTSCIWDQNLTQIYQKAKQFFTTEQSSSSFEPEDMKRFLAPIETFLKNTWSITKCSPITFNDELEVSVDGRTTITGHPDLTSPNVILDVKTTTNFQKMSSSSYLQILAYYALAKASGRNIQTIGIVLPLQRWHLLFDVSQWETWPEFLSILSCVPLLKINTHLALNMSSLLGWHFSRDTGSKEQGYLKSICRFMDKTLKMGALRPGQVFLRSPQGGARTPIHQEEISQIKDLVVQNKMTLFTHAPYTINLAQVNTKKDILKQELDKSYVNDKFALSVTKDELELSDKLGFKGVVVHTGKSLSGSIDRSLDIMCESIQTLLNFATEECPLILETPAGQGTELLTNLDDFINFYLRVIFPKDIIVNQDFTQNEIDLIRTRYNRFKICVDTAHVHGAGYDPYEYLLKLEKYLGKEAIQLIHFNDSSALKGSRLDRHAHVGTGYIGYATMMKVFFWASERQIPMVME